MMSACVRTAAGRVLTEREKVSAQIISNWFANKRKELKKLAREGWPSSIAVICAERFTGVTEVALRPFHTASVKFSCIGIGSMNWTLVVLFNPIQYSSEV